MNRVIDYNLKENITSCTFVSVPTCTFVVVVNCTFVSVINCTFQSVTECTFEAVTRCTFEACCSQAPICKLHDAAKASLINIGVDPKHVNPSYGKHNGELKLAGFFKFKDQDICILPNNVSAKEEILLFDGILKGKLDPYGFDLTEKILSVNVRSQLSSVAKNFDTLYERTYAEALNLHLRCPNMVLGEFYMIPVFEYDETLAKNNIVGFKKNNNIQEHIQKYIYSFGAINNRGTTDGKEYKYERVCLLIVDFNRPIPKIYNTDAELKADGLLPDSTTASIENLNFSSFARSLMKTYEERFGPDKFI